LTKLWGKILQQVHAMQFPYYIDVLIHTAALTAASCDHRSRAVTRLKSLQNSGAFRELFWVLLTKTKKFCGIFNKFGSFLGAFLGAFDKYVEILCYFGSFFNVLVSFGSFLGRF
jgi:hypothetical protein